MPRLIEIPLAPANADTTSGTGSVTGLTTAPRGRAGDMWIACYATAGGTGANHAAPPGEAWELIADTGDINSTLRLSLWRKRNYVSAPVPFTHTGSLRAALSIRAFANALEVEGNPAIVSGVNAQSVLHSGLTAGGPDRVWLIATAKTTAAGGSSALNTPAGFVETTDLVSAHGSNANVNVALHYKTVPAGSTGTQAVDSNDAVNRTYAGIGILLKPRVLGPAR